MKRIPIEGICMIAIIIGYALNEMWVFFSSVNVMHKFWDGSEFQVNDQYLCKGFTDLFLQSIKYGVSVLMARKYCIEIATFFYILYLYSFVNLFMYWYNFCQWPWVFYIMWVCLVIAAVRLWPKVYKLKIVK